MTKIILGRNEIFRLTIVLLLSLSSFSAKSDGQIDTTQHMNNTPNSIFNIIDSFDQKALPAIDKIELILSKKFSEKESIKNFTTLRMFDIDLEDNFKIDSISYRKDNKNSKGIMVFTITRECLKRKDVLQKYGDLKITEHPRGHSLNEETVFSTTRKWGVLSFGFKESNPDCLSSITLNSD